jgi:hypothetical protein
MRFGDVLAGSVYGTTGHIAGAEDLGRLETLIRHNREVLSTFGRIVVATNYGPPVVAGSATAGSAAEPANGEPLIHHAGSDAPTDPAPTDPLSRATTPSATTPSAIAPRATAPRATAPRAIAPSDTTDLRRANRDLWRDHFPDCVLIDSPINRGHSIGTADLDTALFDWCKSAGERWLCKSANDIALASRVLDIPVTDAQFYFINAVSYDALAQRDFDLTCFEGDFFYPQGTFWTMDTTAIDTLVDRSFLDASWRVVSRIPDYNGRIWEHLPGWACERLLANAVRRSGLNRCSLLTPEQWGEVLELTVAERITDCSLKGIEVNGICHTQGLADITAPRTVIR